MKKIYFIATLALICNFASAQIERVSYRGAFAPAPAAMWTDSWANWDPQNEAYLDKAAASTDVPGVNSNVVSITSDITTNTTWSASKTYKLTGVIYVKNNATLTIEAGTVIKGVYTTTGTALVVTKGAKLNAVGRADAPIVFTSAKAATTRAAGDWGGIILLGKAKFNLNGGLNNIEGITATVDTEYGGGASASDTDNSGTMKYCRIEFPGFVFSPNNEINGLTLGAVGSGTTIDYVQVSYSGDDSFEWFGGAVNCKHLVAYRGVDDDFDTDNGFKGVVQFALGIKDPAISDNPSISTSEGFESDNNAGGTVIAGIDNTSCIFSNVTLIGPAKRATLSPTVTVASGHERIARLRRASYQKIFNSIFLDFKNNYLFVDGSAARNNLMNGDLKFKNNILAGTVNSTYPSGFRVYLSSTADENPTDLTTLNLNSNTVSSASASVLTKAYDATSSTLWAAGNDYTANLDYRPGTAAATGADFTDSSLATYINTTDKPLASNVTYCKGAVASPLTATLTINGIILKWYTTASGGTGSITAPTPSTAKVTSTANPIPTGLIAPLKYYVSQVDNTGYESARTEITVTVNGLPTDVLTTITGTDPAAATTAAAISTVSKYVGTTSSFTYATTGITSPSTSTYVWTVPNGVNITAGQGTASITVNYANVSAGAGTIGTINVQASNNGCFSVAKTLTIKKALPAVPTALALYTNATTPVKITDYSVYMGKSTAVTLKTAQAATATGTAYQWELPAGVNVAIPDGVTAVTTKQTYTAEPFLSPNTPSTTVATKYWVVTKNEYTYNVDGVSTKTTISSAKQNIVGSGACKFTLTSGTVGSVLNVGTVFTYNGDTYVLSSVTSASSLDLTCAIVFPLAGSTYPTATTSSSNTTTIGTLTSGSINLNFKRVEVTPARTYTFSVAANASNVCAVGDQLTFNGVTYIVATAVTATSTTIVCKPSALPQPAGTYPSTNPSTNVTGSLTRVSDSSTIAFTKIVKANYDVTTSQDYLPYGTVITTDKPALSIKFDGVTSNTTTKLFVGVKAINGVGPSVSTNAVNAANDAIPGWKNATYTESYVAPNATTFTNASSAFALGTPTISKAKLLALTAAAPAAVTKVLKTGSTILANATSQQITNSTSTTPRTYDIVASALAQEYVVTPPAGCFVNSEAVDAVATISGLTFTITYPISYTSTSAAPRVLKVAAKNKIATSATLDYNILSTTVAYVPKMSNENQEALVSNTEMYPNPATDMVNFNIDASTKGLVNVTIYSLDGKVVMESNGLKVENGTNSFTENVSSLNKGIYLVRITNTTSNDVVTKKLIKN